MLLAIDTENTTYNTGSPFDVRNHNVCISVAYKEGGRLVSEVFWPENRAGFHVLLERATDLCFFNGKYDLHWLKRLGISFAGKRVYCAQVAEYIFTRQQASYPSLDRTAQERLGKHKIDVIKLEYWDKGIQTDQIPRPVLAEYAANDAELTYELTEFYMANMPEHKRKLVNIRMADLLGLQEMEWNGLRFDRVLIEQKAAECEAEMEEIRRKLEVNVDLPCFNWASPVHLSALLYGGVIKETVKVPTDVIFKSGKRAGELKYRNETREHILPRRYKPIKGSEVKRKGVWSVDETYLVQLKGGGDLIQLLLRLKGLQKLNGTYLRGMLKKYEASHGTGDLVHGNFNQCVTETTRLSCSNPNLQNIASDIKGIFRSRYT